ncbi:hypothetical protein [Bradyrhizobium sp. Arg816]|uniref:hypothetical protein n=1 Tax=Bradyrhizobium sp. Arg816 TaxID=2998491 RepID=UPI00249F772B|nr:hypothetical protein [Bradyrhizobium sp. Arg816]MDI3566502.1 hypothetical protein [Bradyrhizobium sp. Arg816]
MSDKHAIEVFQDLSILGPETKRAELREALIAAAATPWERGIDAETMPSSSSLNMSSGLIC